MGVAYQKSRGCNWVACALVIATVAAAVILAVVVIRHKKSSYYVESMQMPPGANFNGNYTHAMQLALTFLDIQKSGKLPANFPIPWRGDSNLVDGKDNGVDLSGGLHDAGDSVKFGLPMAFTATLLSWGVLEYGPAMEKAGQLASARRSIRWVTDYLLRAHASPQELYFQVGDPNQDHKCWMRPEDETLPRPSLKLDPTLPGSEVAAETAAAMAAASMVFRHTDPTYADLLVTHARQLFNFSDGYRASYSLTIPAVQAFYNSTGYGDELLWGATWLYYATGDNTYLAYVTGVEGESFAEWGVFPSWFSWDNKRPAVQVLLARLQLLKPPSNAVNTVSIGLTNYKTTADGLMCAFLPRSPTASKDRTQGGMLWIGQWTALQHGINSALLATFYSDYLSAAKLPGISCSGISFTPTELRTFAASQADYILGNNPMSMSFMVGYGTTYPHKLHHRGASIPESQTVYDCKGGFIWLDSTEPNPNVAYGAIVGGPFKNETYSDSRTNIIQNEASTYNSAAMASLSAGLSVSGNYPVPVSWI